ncbi:2-dehydropantoate 2-reductase [Chloropicon roscoffensis]|uniref:2-dehydropantoate 2-reductase n=1 Tax=Chloropicon roscoffensis TaxID=1461544 RepID=A0AAX4PHQ5_9CHLO
MDPPPLVCVAGVGALGASLAAYMIDAGLCPVLVSRGAQAHALQHEGLRLQDLDGTIRLISPERFMLYKTDCERDPITGRYSKRPKNPKTGHFLKRPNCPKVDVALITCKNHQVAGLLDFLELVLAPSGVVVTCCNGVGASKAAISRFGRDRVVLATTTHAADLTEPGWVRRAGEGTIVLGPSAATTADAPPPPPPPALSALLECPKLRCTWDANIGLVVSRKLLMNAAINAIAAIAKVVNGELAGPELWPSVLAVCEETLPIMAASGMPCPSLSEAVADLESILAATASNRCSTLKDVLLGRRTEVDAINGAIVDMAKESGMPAPLNNLLVALVNKL